KLGEAVRVIERTVRMFGENAIALGFNGGKDCTILVHLYVAVLSRLRRRGDIPSPPEGTKQPRILCFYVSSPRSFEKADIFVKSCRYLYNLNVVSISEPIKSATQRFCRAHPHIRSIIMGVRRDDPHGKLLQAFSPCDKDWAENVIRVSPILDMSFEEVWESTHACGIPICPLYYDGYTSLGYKDNTTKNDALLDRTNGEWLPGWYLLDGTLERMNRAYT
ncbi:adenine nucleotide alpha hydrolases-like protein, partial [Ramicandelaber brevisporus]